MNLRSALHARGWLLLAAALLLVTASVLPPLPLHRTHRVVNQLIVFDVTQSMNVADENMNGASVTRLVYARDAVAAAVRRMSCGSRVGLGVFSGHRTLALLAPVEVCANRYELTEAIGQINTRMAWAQASQISRGVYSALSVAHELPDPPSLVFITDGHEAPPLGDAEGLGGGGEAAGKRIRGLLVGVGGLTPQPIPRSDRDGRVVGWWSAGEVVQLPSVPGRPPSHEQLSSLHEGRLNALSSAAELGYIRLDSPRVLFHALTDPALTHEETFLSDVRWVPASLAGLFLCLFYLPALPARMAGALRAMRRRLGWRGWRAATGRRGIDREPSATSR